MKEPANTLYKERIKRVEDAIKLNVLDRVPFFPMTNLLAVKYGGITAEEAFYDYNAWFSANKKMNLALQPDLYWPPLAGLPGPAFDAVHCKQIRWPGGGGAPPHSSIQFVEGDYMEADEYVKFLDDPSDYLIRTYLPRIHGKLEPLKNLPPIKMMFFSGYRSVLSSAVFANPEIVGALESLYKAGVEAAKYFEAMALFDKEMAELGIPQAFGGAAVWAPFDVFADMYRGLRGSMLDMYREPDRLLEAMEKITPTLLHSGISSAKKSGNRRVFIPLHRERMGLCPLNSSRLFIGPV